MNNYNSNKNKIPIYSDTGKVVGCIKNKILQKNVDSKIHMLQKPPGWAWDKSILDNASEKGITKTILHDMNKNIFYCATINDFYIYGVPINRGYGKQICLPLQYWTKSGPSEKVCKQLPLLI